MLAALLLNIQQLGGGADPGADPHRKPKRGEDYTPLQKKGLNKQVREWVDDIVLEGEKSPVAVEVKKVIEPYRETVDFSIDWTKLRKDLLALEQLLFLYQERENYQLKMIKDDEEFMTMLILSGVI